MNAVAVSDLQNPLSAIFPMTPIIIQGQAVFNSWIANLGVYREGATVALHLPNIFR